MLPVTVLRPGTRIRVKKIIYKELAKEKKIRYETVTVIRQYKHHVLVKNSAGIRRCITNAELYTGMCQKEEVETGSTVLRDQDARGINPGGRGRSFPELLR